MQLKTCVVCKKELPISCFYKRKDSKDGYRNECKYCDKLNNKQYYKSHQQQILNHVTQYTEQNKEKIKQYQNEYRKSNAEKLKDCIIKRSINKRQKLDSYKTPCIKCGENRFYLIDFHHIDPSTKCFTLVILIVVMMKKSKKKFPNAYVFAQIVIGNFIIFMELYQMTL